MIQELDAASSDQETLEHYVSESFPSVYDYFAWRTDEDLASDLPLIKQYMSRKRSLLTSLSPTQTNLAFLALLLEVAERLSFSSAFGYLFKLLNENGFQVNSRLGASAKFLIGANTDEAYIACYEDVYQILDNALGEEDSIDKVLITVVNYYLKAIADFPFNRGVAETIREKITATIAGNENCFLNRPLIWDMLDTNIADVDVAVTHIHQRLEAFLQKDKTTQQRANGQLLEQGTEYAQLVDEVDPEFDQIRRISVNKYKVCGSDAVYYSLHRGVEILTEECQLFAYMNSFGPMHFRKLWDAIGVLPVELFENQLNIIDWGCGQAMATMVLLEYCQDREMPLADYRTLLIEPSILALKRGVLHLRKFDPEVSVSTINRDLDALVVPDFDFLYGKTCLHLFSNILDVHFFSLANLIALVKNRFSGHNFFVIVSPYIDDTRRNRLDAFVDAFREFPSFQLLSTNDNRKWEWVQDWTRVERVFTVDLP